MTENMTVKMGRLSKIITLEIVPMFEAFGKAMDGFRRALLGLEPEPVERHAFTPGYRPALLGSAVHARDRGAPMTAKPSAMLKVWSIEETGYLVRGTLDVELAVQAANKYEGAPEDELREWDATPGLYRCNPCTCSGDHSFDLVSASQRGPGVFEGVLLDHGW